MLELLRPFVGFMVRSPFLLLLLLWFVLRRRWAEQVLSTLEAKAKPLQLGLAALVGASLLTKLTLYWLAQPGFDHVGVQLVNVSRLLLEGYPLYHDLDQPYRYSLLYGPAPYLVNAGLQLLFPGGATTIKAAYLSMFVCCLLAGGRMFQRDVDRSASFMAVVLLAGLCLSFSITAFQVRADALLLFATTISLWLCTRMHHSAARLPLALLVGLLTAVCASCKAHGALYVLPVYALLYLRSGALATAVAMSVMVLCALLPFLHAQISLVNYATYLKAASRHGFSVYMCHVSLNVVGLLLLPFFSFLGPLRAGSSRQRQLRVFVCATALALVGVAVIAGKPGAGSHHLLPFMPLLVYAYIVGYAARREPEDGPWRSPGRQERAWQAAWLGTLVFFFAISHWFELRLLDGYLRREAAQDLAATVETLGDGAVQIALGETGTSLQLANLSPTLVLDGHPYWFDPAAVFDLASSGIPWSDRSRVLIRSCQTRHWLVARGEQPFAGRSPYAPHPALFDGAFRQAFAMSHEKVRSTPYFDIWACRAGPAGPQRLGENPIRDGR